MTLNFLDDVFLLYLTLEPAKRIFERFAFLYTNFCQLSHTPKPANLALTIISFIGVNDQDKFCNEDQVRRVNYFQGQVPQS